MDRKESSSGAPRKIEGIKSKNVWVIAIDVINIIKVRGFVYWSKNVEIESSIIASRLIWIPGIRPEKIPEATPSNRATNNANIMGF